MLRSTVRSSSRTISKVLAARLATSIPAVTVPARRWASQLHFPKVPKTLTNEAVKDFAFKDQKDWDLLRASISKFTDGEPLNVPVVINGQRFHRGRKILPQVNPAKHAQNLANVAQASQTDIQAAIEAAKTAWAT